MSKKPARTWSPDELRSVTGSSHGFSNPELDELCANARRVKELCDLFGIEFRGYRPLVGLLQGADLRGHELAQLVENPELRPYIWDLPEAKE